MPRLSIYAALIAATLALTGCLTGNDSKGSRPSGTKMQTFSYTASGDSFILAPDDDTSRYCLDTSLQTRIRTRQADTIPFRISGKTLSFLGNLDTLISGAVIETRTLYLRIGSGSGLQGLWKKAGEEYEVKSGVMTAQEKSEHDRDMEEAERDLQFRIITVEFTPTLINLYLDSRPAAQFVDRWNRGETYLPVGFRTDSAVYDIDVRAKDDNTVELKGAKTLETVRIRIEINGERTFTSDRADHASHIYRVAPTTCPNPPEPAWYAEFRQSNLRLPSGGLGKKNAASGSESSRAIVQWQTPAMEFIPDHPRQPNTPRKAFP